MQYIEAISNESPQYYNSLFLAGGISGVQNWQQYAVDKLKDLEVTIFNPRRSNIDMSKTGEDARNQITWEYYRLRRCSEILFWFSYETVQPICLFELGSALARPGFDKSPTLKHVFIGCDPKYQRLFDVHVQTELEHPEIEIVDSLDKLIAQVRNYYTGES
jgi:hypothetical protein